MHCLADPALLYCFTSYIHTLYLLAIGMKPFASNWTLPIANVRSKILLNVQNGDFFTLTLQQLKIFPSLFFSQMIALMAIRHFTEDGCLCFPANCYFSLSSSSLSLTTPEDGDILIDFSKNRVTKETMKLLFDLVREKRMYRPEKGYQDPS